MTRRRTKRVYGSTYWSSITAFKRSNSPSLRREAAYLLQVAHDSLAKSRGFKKGDFGDTSTLEGPHCSMGAIKAASHVHMADQMVTERALFALATIGMDSPVTAYNDHHPKYLVLEAFQKAITWLNS